METEKSIDELLNTHIRRPGGSQISFLREMRKRTFTDAIDKYFKIGNNLNQRDVIAVRKTVSGLLKLLYPQDEFDKDAVERRLVYALEARLRVKEQLKKIGGMEFYDVHFSH